LSESASRQKDVGKMPIEYVEIVVETFSGASRGDKGEIRVRPVKGQFYPQTLVVECSRKFRTQFPVGTKFRMQVKLVEKDGAEFLYSHHSWPVSIVKD
jgi:hypothetical protein